MQFKIIFVIVILTNFFSNGQNILTQGINNESEKQLNEISLREDLVFKLKEYSESVLIYRAKGPKNYKSYNKRMGYLDAHKLLENFHNYIIANNFSVTYKSKNYNDLEEFFLSLEEVLIEASNEKVALRLIPKKHNLNYSIFLEVKNL